MGNKDQGLPPQQAAAYLLHKPSKMSNFESPRTYREGQWNPPQSYAESQGYQESHEMSATEASTKTNEGYWTSPPIPPKGWTYDTTSGQHDAPEVVEPPYMYGSHHSRPLSPSSQGGTTLQGLHSPEIPPVILHDKNHHDSYSASAPPPEEPRRFGIRKRMFKVILIVVAIVLLIIGLALGLGLGLGLKKKGTSDPSAKVNPFCRENPELCIGGALGDKYYSTKGAFNGSGIALAGESWREDEHHIFTLYFQHWTGHIRYMQYTTDQKWIGGSISQTVADDAKNATAIATVAYALNDTSFVHVFYISNKNMVKQRTLTNQSSLWEDGPLTKLNITVWDTPGTLGLQACWKGNFYGSSDVAKMPTADGQTNTVRFEDRKAMNIWIPVDDSTFEQYSWFNEAPESWVKLDDPWLAKNVHAGVGCYSWGAGSTTYTMMVNKNNDAEIWWKDTANISSTEQHPLQSWQNATKGTIQDVYPTTSLGYTTFFVAQMADRSMNGFNITYTAENTTSVPENTFTISDQGGPIKGIGGTHMAVTAFNFGKANSLYVFYQTKGDDITGFTRPIEEGEWSDGSLTIPDA